MDNLNLIIENYKQLPTHELLKIAGDPASLEIEIIPHLQEELLNRGKKEEALLLSSYLIKRPRPYKDMTKDELATIIAERVDSGESLESIKLDLKDRGVNFFDIINNENNLKNKPYDYLTSLKEDGLEESEINEKMKAAFSFTEEETDIVHRQLRNKGTQNLVIGYSIVIVTGVIILVVLAAGGSAGIGGILLLGLGVWRIIEGYRQRK